MTESRPPDPGEAEGSDWRADLVESEDDLHRRLDQAIVAQESVRLLTFGDLANMPAPEYLVEDFVRERGFNVLFGPSGVGKSFLALDWSLCIATGRPFFGQAAKRGVIVYIAGEGAYGLHRRIEAWLLARRAKAEEIADHFFVVDQPVNFFQGGTAELAAALDQLPEPPALVVIDTLARCMAGGDENSAKDVGLFVASVDALCDPYGCASLTVHHSGKDGGAERGSSALRGAVDVMTALRSHGSGLKLVCEKQKDDAEFKPWELALVESGESVRIELRSVREDLTPSTGETLEAVRTEFSDGWFTSSEVAEVTGRPKTTLNDALKSLVGRHLEVRARDGRQHEYRLIADSEATDRNRPDASRSDGHQLTDRVLLPLGRDGQGVDGSDGSLERLDEDGP